MSGFCTNYREPAFLLFSNTNAVYRYEISLSIMEPGPDVTQIPSLLGRDVIDHWRMVCDKTKNIVTFLVRTSDQTYTL